MDLGTSPGIQKVTRRRWSLRPGFGKELVLMTLWTALDIAVLIIKFGRSAAASVHKISLPEVRTRSL